MTPLAAASTEIRNGPLVAEEREHCRRGEALTVAVTQVSYDQHGSGV